MDLWLPDSPAVLQGDTLVQLAVAQALWDQTRKDMGRTYGKGEEGRLISTGVYFYRIELANGMFRTKKMLFIK